MSDIKPIVVKFKKLHPDAIVPTKATKGSACFDVYSLRRECLEGNGIYLVETGIACEVPEGYFLDVRPRSGLSLKGVVLLNSPGTLDSDYRGELKIMLYNYGRSHNGNFFIEKGDRIAQIRLVKEEPTEFIEVQELTETDRGKGGFGSTGR